MQKAKSRNRVADKPFDPVWLLQAAGIVIAAWIVYQPTFHFGFTNWDDPTYVKDNPLIRDFSAAGFQKLFSVFLSGNYHPLVLVSYWLEMKWGGGDPTLFHKTNFFLHALNSLLVFSITARLIPGRMWALMGALLFAIHPLHVESVAWVTERKDVLYGFFLLAAIRTYLLSNPDKPDKWYAVSLILFVLSGLSKGQAVALVPAIVMLDLFQKRNLFSRAYLIRILPFGILALGIGILAVYAQSHQANVRIQTGYGFVDQMLIGFQGFWFYLSRTVFPHTLSAFYPYPDISGGIPVTLWIQAFLGLACMSLLLVFWKINRAAFALYGLFFLTLLPVLQFLPVGNAAMADRYYYIPSLGLCLLLSWAGNALGATYQKVLPGVLVVFLAYQTWSARERVLVWKDSFTLWQNVIDHYPQAAIAWNSLANAWYEQNNYQEAAGYFEKAIALDATDPKSFNNLGNCYDRTGRSELAVEQFKKALIIRPNDPMVYTNLGVAYDKLGKLDLAIEAQQNSVRIAPNPLGYANLANVLEKAGRLEESAAMCRKSLELDPNYALAYNNLGVALYRMGKVEEAIENLKQAARLGYPSAQEYLRQNGIAW